MEGYGQDGETDSSESDISNCLGSNVGGFDRTCCAEKVNIIVIFCFKKRCAHFKCQGCSSDQNDRNF